MATWIQQHSPTNTNLNSVFGNAANNAYACGDSVILRWNGTSWAVETLPAPLNTEDYVSVWVAPSGNVYAVSSGGHLAKKSGGVWTDKGTPFSATPLAVGGSDDTHIWVSQLNEGTLRVQESTDGGDTWVTVRNGSRGRWVRVFDSSNVYIVAEQYLNSWDGATWHAELNYFPTIASLRDIWPYDADDSHVAAGTAGIWSFASRGTAVQQETTPPDNLNFRTIFGKNSTTMYSAGANEDTSKLFVVSSTGDNNWAYDTVPDVVATPSQMWVDAATGTGFVVADLGQIFATGAPAHISASSDVMAQDLVTLKFAAPVRNSSTIRNPASYRVTALSGPNTVQVAQVQVGTDAVMDTVYLWVTGMQIGELYQVETLVQIQLANGADVSVLSPKFIGRTTKIDSMVNSRPKMYDMSSTSLLRKVLQAIGQEDDRIGGSRNDRIVPPVE